MDYCAPPYFMTPIKSRKSLFSQPTRVGCPCSREQGHLLEQMHENRAYLGQKGQIPLLSICVIQRQKAIAQA